MRTTNQTHACSIADELVAAANHLSATLNRLRFRRPLAHVYNPLTYAWDAHEAYLRKFAQTRKRVVFLGMNPGPFGMVQTGVPFGEIRAVRDWMNIITTIAKPRREHPRRPVEGFDCRRSEVSGRRLWGLFAQRFVTAENFFGNHFVANYCPLAFFDEAGRNLTPDKLPAAQATPMIAACDRHLRRVVDALRPEWLIGIGDFAGKRASQVFPTGPPKIGRILHPSPASPAANKDWGGTATAQLKSLGVL
jgi:single-strand selective monofunctional uracil DNA glycosylase